MNNVNILGIEISDISKSEALAKVRNFINDKYQHYIVTPNPEIVLSANKDDNLRTIINHADLSLPDGFGLKVASKILGQKLRNRVTGSDFMESIIALAESENWPVFLLGGLNEKIAEQAAWHLRYKYKNVKIAGHASGGEVEFREGKWQASDSKLLKKITDSGAVIVFVAFGCPRQEKWVFQNLDKLPNIKLAMTVGGTLDFLAGARKRAVYALRKIGLEWLWRLIIEPTRIKRIWNATAVFVWKTIKWRIRYMFVYRQNVAAFIVNKNNEIFLQKRAYSKDDHWQMPQGGVDEGEEPEEGVKREVQEETGIHNLEIIGLHPDHHTYEFPKKWHKLNNGYKGQQQNIFYLKYTGDNSDIKLDKREASDYSWVYIDDVIDMIYEKRKDMAQMAIDGYKEITNSNNDEIK